MKIHILTLLLIAFIGACTPKMATQTSSSGQENKEMLASTKAADLASPPMRSDQAEIKSDDRSEPSSGGMDAALKEPVPLDPRVRIGKLENGMRYYIQNNKKPEHRAELRLAVAAGSINEDDDQLGLAHFVEHMAFNGTKHFEKVNWLITCKVSGLSLVQT
ncbi:MAG: insulinase family protein [Saprospiraceae bacterium]|nr:insulinase family protein [Saprospiraceae bacterium]